MTDARPETKLQIRIVPVTPLQQNCSLIWDTATKHAVLVDPGGDVDTLMGALDHFGLTLREMWLTHGHLDHAGAADFVGSSGSITFAAGEQTKTISIPITPDTLDEANEHFSLVLTSAQGATIARATATAIIVDDDTTGTPPPPPLPPSTGNGDLEALFAVVNSWSGGFQGGVTLDNDGAGAMSGWQVRIDMTNEITDIWNAVIVSHDANGYVVKNAAWNGTIAHDGEASFGFVASGAFNAAAVHVHGIDSTPAPGGSIQSTVPLWCSSMPGCPARTAVIIGPAGGIARLNTVAKAPLPDRSVLRIRLSSRIRSGPRRPANVSARQAMRNATPRAASSGPWPATSPIITCTVRSGVWTKS